MAPKRGSIALIVMLLSFGVALIFGFWLVARRNAELAETLRVEAEKEKARRAIVAPPPVVAEVKVETPPPPKEVVISEEERRAIAIREVESQPAPPPLFDPTQVRDRPIAPVRRPAAMASSLDKRVWAAVVPSRPRTTLEKAPFQVPAQGTPEYRALSELIAEYGKIPPDRCIKHPLSGEFPGDVASDVPRMRAHFNCTQGVKGWVSTGFYAPPGELVTVELSEDDAKRGFSIQIGAHTDNLMNGLNTEWKRFPVISRRFPLTAKTVHIANPFGGLVYVLDAENVRPERPLLLRFIGVVKAPVYTKAKTTPLAWEKACVATRGVPWGELACERIVMTLPGDQIRALSDPLPYMNYWDKVVNAQYHLAGVAKDPLKHERIVPDAQIAYGVMHPGYPIAMRLAQAPEMTHVNCFIDENWGVNHEIGHNLQRKEWTFAGYGETTNNLFGLYAMETVSKIKLPQVRDGMNWRAIQIQAIAFPGNDDPFVLLSYYSSVLLQFGWEPLRKTFESYETDPVGELGDAELKAEFVYRWSVACGVDLRDYSALFGFPRSSQADSRFSALASPLSTWMPKGCPPDTSAVKRIRRIKDMNSNEDSHIEARLRAAALASETAKPETITAP